MVQTDEFAKEIDVTLDNIEQRITNHLVVSKPTEPKAKSVTKLKLNQEVSEVNFVDPQRQIKHLKRIMK